VAGVRGGSYQVWRVLIALIAAACVVQIFLAGRGAFGIHGAAKLDDQKSFDPHRALGEIIGLLAVLAFLAALLAWRNKRLIWLTFAPAFMAEILQHFFATPKHPWVAGLHALDGVAILGLAAMLAHRAWRPGDSGSGPQTPRSASAAV
jgi:Mn2+/Fe2+ NRAMP family transporter